MKTLIVTASSKTKRTQDETPFVPVEKTFTDSLNGNMKKIFLEARKNLLNEFRYDQGPDTHHELKPSGDVIYLPAFSRYSGRTYSKITIKAWDTLNKNPNEFDCIILSAFYGLIRFDEPIRNYTIKQVTKMPSGKAIGKYWRDQGAKDWLYDYIKNNEINKVKFVLSTSYSDIIGKEKLIVRLKDDLDIHAEDKQFRQGGMKSMILRGQYINDLLLDQL